MRRWLILFSLLLLAAHAHAQPVIQLKAIGSTNAGTIAANGGSITIDTSGMSTLRIQTLDSYSGTWEAQCSVDGSTYDADDELNLSLEGSTAAPAQSVTDAVGVWTASVAGCRSVKLIATAGFAASDVTFAYGGTQSGGSSGSSGGGSTFNGVLLDAASGDAITDTANDALRVNVVAGGAAGGTSSNFAAAIPAAGTAAGMSDGTNMVPLLGTTTQADNLANTLDGLNTTAFAYIFDGSTWDRWTGAVTGTVTANLSATDNAVLDDIADGIAVTNAGTFAVQANPGTAANWGVHAEDSVHSTTQAGIQILGVRQDSQADFAADGDYVPFSVDGDGGLRVSIISGAGSGGTALADDADFTDGTTSGTPIGGVAESASPTTVTEGDFGWAAITLNRALKVTLYSAAGAELTPSADMTVGSAYGATAPGSLASYKEFDGSALPTTTNVNTEEEANPIAVTLQGVQYGFLVNEDGSKQLGKLEDDAHASADYALPILTRRIDVAASSAGTSADYATLDTDALGLLWTRFLDPCSGVAKTHIPIDIVTATTTELTSALAGASTNYYVCSLNLVSAGANNVALVDDDTDNCASVTSGVAGGTTAGEGWNFAANGGIAFGNGSSAVFKTNGTNRVLCLVTSAAVQLSGSITVVAAP